MSILPGRFAKRCLDLCLAVPGLLLLSPLLLVVALLVKLTSPGPVFFRQKRLGRNGRIFEIYKFRSMRVNAPDIRNPDGSSFSSSNDPRLTPIGNFLRTSSLDELPQLINVVTGDMSLVGPRPDQADQIQYYTDAERRKLQVKPGITGLAQLSGRNEIEWAERKRLDVQYVDQQSFWLDVKLLALTVPYVFLKRGIYSGK